MEKNHTTEYFYFAQMLRRFVSRRCYAEKKAQMLRRFFCVTSAKTNLRNICENKSV